MYYYFSGLGARKKKLHIALSHGRRLLLLQYVLVVVKGGSCWLIWFSRSCCRIAALSMTWPGSRRRNSERLKGSSTTSTTRSSLLFDKAMTVSQQSTKYTFLRQFAVVQLLHDFLQHFSIWQIICQDRGANIINLDRKSESSFPCIHSNSSFRNP